ncbi:MAG: NADPH-dependent FMN reductase [Christensenellaceae bacterium]|jgi:chromate reductase
MSEKIKIGVLVGSLREEAYSKKIEQYMIGFLEEAFDITIIPIGELPLYVQDFDDLAIPPASWQVFRETVKKQDGFLFVTPEYNRSIPAVLKNALDIGSRPAGSNIWAKKTGTIIAASPGAIGGFGVCRSLREVTTYLDMYIMQQPEVYLANVAALMDETGDIVNEGTKEFLQVVADAFVEWMHAHTS